MNYRRFTFVFVFVVAFVSLVIFLGPMTMEAQENEPNLPAAAPSAMGTAFTYQGRLTDSGIPANGSYNFRFYLWDDEVKTTLLGTYPASNTIAIGVSDGYFTTTLDFGVGIFDGGERWLEIEVNGTLLSPLQQLTPAPYAIYAKNAPWSGLTGIPPGFADGTDDDTTYSNGVGLVLTGTVFSINFAGSGIASTVARSDHDHDASYVNEGQPNSITSAMVQDGTLSFADLHQNGCGSGQVMKWNGASWGCAGDEIGSGNFWALTGNSGTDHNTNYLGTSDNQALEIRVNNVRAFYLEPNVISPNVIGGFGGNYALEGVHGAAIAGGGTPDEDSVYSPNRVTDHYGAVVGGANNQAGNDDQDLYSAIYAFVGGGAFNSASGGFSSVVGGDANQAIGNHVAIGGGMVNAAWGPASTISGGEWNQAGGVTAAVGGGSSNHALADYSTIGGGVAITVTGYAGTVAGGENNISDGELSTIGGGLGNDTIGAYSTIGGGYANIAQGYYAVISGGMTNDTVGDFSVVGGGYDNAAMNPYSTVGGGSMNIAWADYATICGGGPLNPSDPFSHNQITDNYGTIGGGAVNNVGSHDGDPTNAPFATISGGVTNTASAGYTFIGGGQENVASGIWSAVCGGDNNTASGDNSIISGGRGHTASGLLSVIGGGVNNSASDDAATISGGSANTASGPGSSVGGGYSNAANGTYGTVGGGDNNIANNMHATVGGGYANFAYGDSSTIAGGNDNYILSGSTNGTITGGEENLVTDEGGTVGGGFDNQAGNNSGGTNDATYAFVGGGYGNTGSAHSAAVAGGYDNTASGGYSFIGGGDTNTTSGGYGSIGGGRYNTAGGLSATVGGGDHNQTLEDYATVGGGGYNTASGLGSVVAGGGGISGGSIYTNTASGERSTVSGGIFNLAGGNSSTVGGGESNTADSWASTVSGGSANTASGLDSAVGGGANNIASGASSTVGGGWTNRAEASASTVSGGDNNTASGDDSAVGGGILNQSIGSYATIPGGHSNEAHGDYSFAAGRNAWIGSGGTGSFVWSDSNTPQTKSWGPNEFVARATGGFWLISGIDGVGNITSGAKLDANDSQWKTLSDREMKTTFNTVNGKDVLESLARIPIQTWQYKAQKDEALHMGPMAQDFYSAFGLGKDDKYIGTMDLDGVALASIQGLYAISQEQAEQIQDLQAENASLRQQLGGGIQGGMTQSISILVYVLTGIVLLLMVVLIWVLFRLRSLRPLEEINVR